MAVRYELDGPVLRFVCEGEYDVSDMTGTFARAMEDPDCPRPVELLVDVRESGSMESRSPHELRRIVAFLQPYVERIGGRCAVVVSSDVQYGLSRMSSVYAGDLGVEASVFRDEEAALEWLRAARPRRS